MKIDKYSIRLDLENSMDLKINDIKLVIKHNDVGYSVDTYFKGTLIRDEQVFFDDVEEVVENIMLNNK